MQIGSDRKETVDLPQLQTNLLSPIVGDSRDDERIVSRWNEQQDLMEVCRGHECLFLVSGDLLSNGHGANADCDCRCVGSRLRSTSRTTARRGPCGVCR